MFRQGSVGTGSVDGAGEVHFVGSSGGGGCSVEKETGVGQICIILWADNIWIMSESKAGLRRMRGGRNRQNKSSARLGNC